MVYPDQFAAFLRLWKEFCHGDQAVLDKTLDLLWMLWKDPNRGVSILHEGSAGLLWYQVPGREWDARKVAVGWGTYVRPEDRRRGLAKSMWERATEDLREKGFSLIVLEPSMDQPEVISALERSGFKGRSMQMHKEL